MANGPAPSSLNRLKPVFGWWSLDPEGPTLVNSASGQRVRYIGPEQPANIAPSVPWHRFEYEDKEVQYPVLVRTERTEFQERLERSPYYSPRYLTGTVLRVDHNLSAGLWRQHRNSNAGFPPYGLWQRVDDCITDAFSCWTDLPFNESGADLILVRGGWLNAKWHSGIDRTFPVVGKLRILPSDEGKRPNVAEAPFIQPLECPAPSRWKFHALEVHELADPIELPLYVRLSNAVFTRSSHGMPVMVVPYGVPLTGLDGVIPFLQSEDGETVLFPEEGAGKDLPAHVTNNGFRFQLTDRQFVANFRGYNLTMTPKSHWIFRLDTVSGVYRNPEMNGDLFYEQGVRVGPRVPSIALWKRLTRAILDSWFLWEGSSARCQIWETNIALSSTDAVEIYPNYVGGRWERSPLVARLNIDQRRGSTLA